MLNEGSEVTMTWQGSEMLLTENYEKPPVESMHWFGTKQIKRTERWKKFSWYGETKDQANTC